MGNNATGGNPTLYPAALDQFGESVAIAVGGIDNFGERSVFSQTGNHIDVTAPAGNYFSLFATPDFPTYGKYDGNAGGTSGAAAIVSGVSGLLLGLRPDLYNDDIEQILKLTADQPQGYGTPNIEYGYGRIDAEAALMQLLPPHLFTRELHEGGESYSVAYGPYECQWPHFDCRIHEVRRYVAFNQTFESVPNVWGVSVGSTGYTWWGAYQRNQFHMEVDIPGFCEVVPGTVTTSGCWLRTYICEKIYLGITPAPPGLPSGTAIGDTLWYPSPPAHVKFHYSVLGTLSVSETDADLDGERVSLTAGSPMHGHGLFRVSGAPAGEVILEVFDVAGRRVRSFRHSHPARGRLELEWNGMADNGRPVRSGI